MRARVLLAVPLFAAVLLASGCGDTLVDHGATWAQGALQCRAEAPVWCPDRVAEGQNACFPESPSACGSFCEDCTTTMTSPPAAMGAACMVATGSCGYACAGGKFKCGPAGDRCCDAIEIAAGDEHTCAIVDEDGAAIPGGSLVCWGLNNWGQVTGQLTANPITVPFKRFGAGVTAVTAGHYHTCAVVNGAVQCWGWNDDNQAEPPPDLGTVTALAAGFYHTCAIDSAGAVRCWGRNNLNQTAGGSPALPAAVKISAGWDHTCVLLEGAAGEVRCWGSDAAQQLGNGNPDSAPGVSSPVIPVSVGSVAFLASGRNHTCAANGADDRPVVCWGAQPGPDFGLEAAQALPAPPTKLGGDPTYDQSVSGITAGRTHTCVIRETVKCFGPDNVANQLGGPITTPRETVDVANTVGASRIAAGSDHTCAIVGGGVVCWGMNSSGQLGNGSTTFPGAPVFVSGQ
jgi:alpha-tubulin suppressor-like RCC1 family protein